MGGAFAAAQTAQTAAFLTFFGALLVALIAAVTAGRRQQRELDAERIRLSDRLAHERRIQDIDHLRAFLDEAAGAYEEARVALATLCVELSSPGPAMHEKYKRAIEAERAVNVLSRRMTMRFSPDHPVAKTYATVSHTLDGQERHLRGIVDRVVDHDPQTGDVVVLTEAEDEVDTAHGAAAATGFQAFAEAARAEVGATGRGT